MPRGTPAPCAWAATQARWMRMVVTGRFQGRAAAETPRLDGRVAVVTGGGRGLGRVLASSLAERGASVAVLARSGAELARTVELIRSAGGLAGAWSVDVTDPDSVERTFRDVERVLGPIDVLVNNAGECGPCGSLWEVDAGRWWRAIEVNLAGVHLCSAAVLPGMVERGRGRIINVASHAGAYRWPTMSAYAVSKAAVIRYTEHVAVEARRHGVTAFAIHPGLLTIGLTEEVLAHDAPADSSLGRIATWIRAQLDGTDSGCPRRAARLVALLASGEGDALSGRYLSVEHDVAALLERADEVERDDLHTLRIRELS